jgi:proteic killer suppression protein
MIVSVHDQGAEDVFNGRRSKHANKACRSALWRIARRKLDQLASVAHLSELRATPGNRLEALTGDRSGQHSIRINQKYRVVLIGLNKDL